MANPAFAGSEASRSDEASRSSGCTAMSTIRDQIDALRDIQRQRLHAKEIASILGLSEGALTAQRRRGTGVPAVCLKGCRPIYLRDEVIAWLQAHLGGHR